MEEEGTKVCQKCGKRLKIDHFYQRKDKSKVDLCKECLTMHIDNFDENTFLWILKDMDLPYIPSEWNVLRNRAFAKNPNLNGMSVFGKYLSKMKLKQWLQYGWEDSEKLQALEEAKNKLVKTERKEYEEKLKAQLDNGEINEAQYKTLVSTSTQNQEQLYAQPQVNSAFDNPYNNHNDFMDESLFDLGKDLTDEDKTYLAMKWGRLYKPAEWVELEKTYHEMEESFDIQDADTINTLILICKTNLKMNQYLDQGDIEGYQKLSKVSTDLRKSAKFTAAQNKEQKGDFVDSVGELVSYCEKYGSIIPKYEINTPLDIIDKVILDLKNYTKELIYEDKSLSKQIEDYLKKVEISKQMKIDQHEAEMAGLDAVEINDEDHVEYERYLESQREQDARNEEDE